MVWIDTCDSFGTDGAGGLPLVPDYSFGDTFGETSSFSGGVALGWGGQSVEYGAYPAPKDTWTAWRRNFWDHLFNGGKNFQTSLDQTDSITTKGFPYGQNPQERHEYIGNYSVSF